MKTKDRRQSKNIEVDRSVRDRFKKSRGDEDYIRRETKKDRLSPISKFPTSMPISGRWK